MQENHFNYEVSMSYAHEDRQYVDSVTRYLKAKGIKVFSYQDAEIDSWGKNLIEYLDSVYQKESKFCIVFISKYYISKSWTRFENRIIQSRILKEDRVVMLPVLLDDTELPGLFATIAYLSVKEYRSPKRLASVIEQKIKEGRDITPLPIDWSERMHRIFNKKTIYTVGTLLAVSAWLVLFTNKLTPVDNLAQKLYEASRKDTQYAVCKDGRITFSLGTGTCSYHGGVDYYADTAIYLKTPDECNKEAVQLSWLGILEK